MVHSLQAKIFVLFVGLLISVQSVAILTIYKATEEQAQLSIDTRLNNATTIFNSLFESSSEKLNAIAEAAAQDGGLRENFYEDNRSFLVALNNHRKRISADIAFAIDDQQVVKAQLIKTIDKNSKTKITKGPHVGTKFKYHEWLLFSSGEILFRARDEIYQVSIVPVKSGSENIGWIGFGFAIDQKLANEFEELTGLTTAFILNKQGLNTTVTRSAGSQINSPEVSEHLIATGITIGQIGTDNSETLSVQLQGSRADLLDSIETRWLQFLALAGLTLLLSLAGAYMISASISKPIKQLVVWAKFIAKGNYEEPVSITDKGEMGQLAKEFSVMQKEVLSREKLISHRAFHDPLTELPNRNRLLEVIQNVELDTQTSFLLYLINISHINQVNSSLGHEVGDQVIIEFANRLKQLESQCQLFHLGADEFILLIPDATNDIINDWSSIVQDKLLSPYVNESMSFNLRARAGVSIYPTHSINPEELIQKASTAMKFSKDQRLDISVYDSSQDIDTLEQLNLMNDLSLAIEDNQLRLYYQPKVTLSSNHTETVEALVRWQHPKLGMIPPDKFISIAEQTGLINPLTEWVLSEAVSQYSKWATRNINLTIAINISAENLKSKDFYHMVCNKIKSADIPVEAILLEITESAVVENPEEAINLLQRFKDKGFKLSIDDYGTGYSSLAQLKDLPVNELKIDMSFVRRLPNDEGDKIIVRSTIELAHNMGLTVVAEGVENKEAMQWLADKQCERIQGYYISRPIPANELESWLEHTPYYQQQAMNNE
ncbi:MAG: EAL domain-containing protein [Kangiellaceae bacterium]|nr:EAL domain-containing protein [Kangiellaceae bacterium]